MRVYGRTSLRRRLILLFAVSTLMAVMAPSAFGAGGTFTDDDDSIFEADIEWMADAEITAGCNPPVNDHYCPTSYVTRGQMAAFLVRAMGYTSDGGGDLFVDDDSSIFEGDIDRLATAGVTRGCNPPDNDMFCPTSYVTRGQMAAFLVRAMSYTDDGGGDLFVDDDTSIFEGDIDRLATAGVTRGCNPPDNDNFCPNSYVTRGQMAAFLHRALGGTTPPPSGSGDIEVSGKIVNAGGAPVAGATVTITSDPIVVTTDAAGEWSTTVGPGAHTLSASKNGTPLGSMCFVGVETVRHDLGIIGPNTDDGCRTPYPTAIDADGDRVSDADETAGMTITLHRADGSTESRKVTSDPNTPDTDGDGLWDDEERSYQTDPRRWDTDADRLSDYAEVQVFGSGPANEDSDGDACPASGTCVPAPKMFDGNELLSLGTSPTLDDTDGDGLTDYTEVNQGGTNPLVADLPNIRMDLYGSVEISIVKSDGQQCESETSSLVVDSSKNVRTDTEATKMSLENTVRIQTEVEVGTSNWPPSANAKITTDTSFKHGWFQESSTSWTKESVESTTNKSACRETYSESYNGGTITADIRVTNASTLSLKMRQLTLNAYLLGPEGGFRVVGPDALTPTASFGNGRLLGPGGSFTAKMRLENVDPDAMRSLYLNPTALMLEVADYELIQLDKSGNEVTDYDVVAGNVGPLAAPVIIDYGDGRVERHMVATNVYRNADGSAAGLGIGQALDTIGAAYTTRRNDAVPAVDVLYSVNDKAAYDDCVGCPKPHVAGFWVVSGDGAAFSTPAPPDFEDLVLFPASLAMGSNQTSAVRLVYVNDADGDGLFDREENLRGTDKSKADSDGDTLDDYFETRTGWEVPIYPASYRGVFPDPRFGDTDGDFWDDPTEYGAKTDPTTVDTDSDGKPDNTDDNPLQGVCVTGELANLKAWWDGTAHDDAGTLTADDIWAADGFVSDGAMLGGADVVPDQHPSGPPADAVYRLNPATDQTTEYVEVPSDSSLSAGAEFSFSAWVKWSGPTIGEEWQTLVVKGADVNTPAFALLASDEGELRALLYRQTRDKCWGYAFFSWIDGLCKDTSYAEFIGFTTDPIAELAAGDWVHVTVTYGDDRFVAYHWSSGDIDPVLHENWVYLYNTNTWAPTSEKKGNAIGSTYYEYKSVWSGVWFRTWTEYLQENGLSFYVAGSTPHSVPFRGFVDDVLFAQTPWPQEHIRSMVVGSDSGICPMP